MSEVNRNCKECGRWVEDTHEGVPFVDGTAMCMECFEEDYRHIGQKVMDAMKRGGLFDEEVETSDEQWFDDPEWIELNRGEPFDVAWDAIIKMPNLAGETLFDDETRQGIHHYVVSEDVWNEAGLDYYQNPTLDELEALLGRTLTPDDFTNAPLNWSPRSIEQRWSDTFPHEYETLVNRVGGLEGRKKLAQSWIDSVKQQYDPKTLFWTLLGEGVSLDDLPKHFTEEEMAQIASRLESHRNWERENPKRAEEIRARGSVFDGIL